MHVVKQLLLIVGLFLVSGLHAQTHKLSIKLIDSKTGLPVSDAHVFVDNTTFGTLSDKDGVARLSLPQSLSEDLLITHILYETKLVRHALYMNFDNAHVIALEPTDLEIPTLTINARRSKKWKKNFKKFRKAFLGTGKSASQCNNP